MKISKLKLYICLSLFSILAACEFEPSNVIFKEVNPPITPSASINLAFDEDTIYITGIADVNFSFLCAGHQIYNTSFNLDGDEIYSTKGDSLINGTIHFDYRSIKDGTYMLEMVSTVDSKSGSIADALGAEAFNFTKTWTLVFLSIPVKPKITFIGLDNGHLKLFWEKSKSLSFDEYQIERSYEFHNDYIFPKKITDPDSSFFIDTTYIAGSVSYYIKVKEGLFSSTQTITYNGIKPDFSIHTNNNLDCIFNWSKTPFYNNFGSVKITYMKGYNGPEYTLFETTNINDTSFVMKDGVFDSRNYYIYYYPKKPSFGYYKINQYHNSPGDKFYPNSMLCFSSISPYNIYGINSNYIFKYSSSTGDFKSLSLNTIGGMAASSNGKYIYCNSQKINPETTNSEYLTVSLGLRSCNGRLSVSDNGLMVGHYNSYNHIKRIYENYIECYDLIQKKSVQIILAPSHIEKSVISSDGQYLAFTGSSTPYLELWKYNADSGRYTKYFNQQGDYLNKHVVFQQIGNENRFYIVNGSKVELWSCETLKILKTFQTIATNILQIDPVTQNVVGFKRGRLLIYKSDDFSLLWDVGMDSMYGNVLPFVVVNSVIYSNDKKLNLENYDQVH